MLRRIAGGAILVLVLGGLVGCGGAIEEEFIWGRGPAWSADGKWIAFDQNVSTPGEMFSLAFSSLTSGFIWVMGADGSGPRQITTRGRDLSPSWAPDNNHLTFVSAEGGQLDIWRMDAAGGERIPLTDDRAADMAPAWSPDGTSIAYASFRNGNWDLWVMNADGSHQRQLTFTAAHESDPAWSPDSRSLAFASNRDRGNWDLWVINLDGTGVRQLTRKDGESQRADGAPAWSPDGTHIAYASWDGNWDVWLVGADGNHAQPLTTNEAHDGDPAWSPNGNQIAFASARNGWWHIWVMDRDGTNVRLLTGQAQ